MTISADLERDFYDASYAQFLNLPESDLVCTRQTLLADLANPAKPIYERRRLYSAILKTLLAEPVVGRAVLDYGCGTGDWGLMLAGEGANVTFLDLSPVAIQVTQRRAAAGGVADRVRGVARDASDLSCFRDEEFDLIYGSAAVHHTLKYPGALEELLRVLRPGGRLVLAETYGNN
ncbi:MAG: class I SAM-dependent methyltransferase, partial [Bryobacteraceae bacterium]